MSGVIKPFETIKAPARKGLVTTGYLERRLRAVLGKLGFSGSAVKVLGDGQIQIDTGGAGEGDHPFKLRASDGGVVISPGRVAIPGNSAEVVINGRGLVSDGSANWREPVLPLPVGTTDICLELRYTPELAAVNVYGVPISFVTGGHFGATIPVGAFREAPSDVRAQIDYTTGDVGQGRAYIRLGQVIKSAQGSVTVLAQDWRSSIAVAVQGDGYLFLQMA